MGHIHKPGMRCSSFRGFYWVMFKYIKKYTLKQNVFIIFFSVIVLKRHKLQSHKSLSQEKNIKSLNCNQEQYFHVKLQVFKAPNTQKHQLQDFFPFNLYKSAVCKPSQSSHGVLVLTFEPSTVVENLNYSCLDSKKVLVVHLRTAEPHELCEPEQVLGVVACVAAADGDLGSDLLVRRRAEIDGVVRGSDVDQSQQGVLACLFGDELHHLCGVAPQQNFSHVKILKGLFHLGPGHLVGNAPCTRLRFRDKSESVTIQAGTH